MAECAPHTLPSDTSPWKDADPHHPDPVEATAEYAKLQ